MQDKSVIEQFLQLRPDEQVAVAQHLPTSDVVNYALISKRYLTLFTPILNTRKFLHYGTRGEYGIVKAMLTDTIELIYEQGSVTDCSGRTFEKISLFEYTLWAKDKPMWTVMLECIPQNEKRSKVIATLQSQYKNLITNGITYSLNGERFSEHHFDFENTIIKALQTQVDFDGPDVNWAEADEQWTKEADEQWKKGVGGAQRLLPMHVVHEYCSNRPFHPLPDFTQQLVLPASKQFYNFETADENWFAVGSKLGVDFAIIKADYSLTGGQVWWAYAPVAAAMDLDAMKALCKARTNDFINLESQLEALAVVDEKPKPAPQT